MQQNDGGYLLASGGRVRADGGIIEVWSPSGEIVASLAIAQIERIDRTGAVVAIHRRGIPLTTLTLADEGDAVELAARLHSQRMAAPTTVPVAPAAGGGIMRVFKWGCFAALGLAGLIIVLAIIGVLVSSGDDDTSSEAEVIPTATRAATAGIAGQVTPTTRRSTSTATATAEPPAPTSTPRPIATATPVPSPTPPVVGQSRANPIPFGATGATSDWEVQVLEVVRGADALARLKDANQFNADPLPGMEYVLASIRVKYIGAESDAQSIDFTWFQTTGDAYIKHGWAAVVEPEPELRAELFTGGEAVGWTTLQAREGETNLVLIFEPFLSSKEGDELFLALSPGAAVQPISTRLAEANDIGFDRNQPAAFGEHIVGDTWEIWVIESVRGEVALARIKEANMFNDDPSPGMEYVLVKIGARNVNPQPGSSQISSLSFKLTGDAGRVYENPILVEPAPELSFDVYAGGSVEGWVALECAAGETNLRVVYEPLFSFTAKPRFLALE